MVTARRSFNISDILESDKDIVSKLQRKVSPVQPLSCPSPTSGFSSNVSSGLLVMTS